MKRLFITCLLASPALVATGCPMYDDTGCESELDCGPGYDCHIPSRACVRDHADDGVTRCLDREDCEPGELCDRYGRCVADAAGGESGAGHGGAEAGGAGRGGAAGETSSSGGNGIAGEVSSSGSSGVAGDASSSGNGGAAGSDGGAAGEVSAGAGG
jgi:hypothetical protein